MQKRTKKALPPGVKRQKAGAKIKFVVDEKVVARCRNLAGFGFTQEQMASYYGIALSTFAVALSNHPELQMAIKSGRVRKGQWVVSKLMQAIKKGNVKAIIFFCKAQLLWRDNIIQIDDSGKVAPAPLSLTVNNAQDAARIYQDLMTRK